MIRPLAVTLACVALTGCRSEDVPPAAPTPTPSAALESPAPPNEPAPGPKTPRAEPRAPRPASGVVHANPRSHPVPTTPRLTLPEGATAPVVCPEGMLLDATGRCAAWRVLSTPDDVGGTLRPVPKDLLGVAAARGDTVWLFNRVRHPALGPRVLRARGDAPWEQLPTPPTDFAPRTLVPTDWGLLALGGSKRVAALPDGAPSWQERKPMPLDPGLNVSAVPLPGGGALAVSRGAAPLRYLPRGDRWIRVDFPGDGGDSGHGRLTSLGDGRVLATGGPEPAIFSEKAGWKRTAAFPGKPRQDHGVAALKDGRVLLCGGMTVDDEGFLSDTWLYDPTKDAWTAGPDMGDRLWGHPMLDLGDGRVLALDRRHKALVFDLGEGRWRTTIAAPFEVDHRGVVLPFGPGRALLWSRSGVAIYEHSALQDPPAPLRAATLGVEAIQLPAAFAPGASKATLTPGVASSPGQKAVFRAQIDVAVDQGSTDLDLRSQLQLSQRVLPRREDGGAALEMTLKGQTGTLFAENIANKAIGLPPIPGKVTLELGPDGRVVAVTFDGAQPREAQELMQQLTRSLQGVLGAGFVPREVAIGDSWEVPLKHALKLSRAPSEGQPGGTLEVSLAGSARYELRGWREDGGVEVARIDVTLSLEGAGTGRSGGRSFPMSMTSRAKGQVYWDAARGEPTYAVLYAKSTQSLGERHRLTIEALSRVFVRRVTP